MTGAAHRIGYVVVAVLLLGQVACSTTSVSLQEDPEDYREAVARLQREIAENPGDSGPLRDLGAIYVRTQRPVEGHDYLQKAFSRDQSDPKTLFYLGVASEKIGKMQTARRVFERYAEVPEDSPYRRLMQGRYEWLLRQEIRREIAEMVQREQELTEDNVNARIVAVLPLTYQGDNEQYAPLGRGLSEMISVDLAHINDLRLVERVRLQELLNELELAQSDYVDPSTAPRVGYMLGAGRLVGGAYNVLGDEDLRMDVALAELERGVGTSDMETRSGALTNLFELQKEMVFRIIDRLGIELTSEERAAIEYVPTENLQAFLAYSRGLLEEDAGNFEAAAQAFRRARELDPGFERAAEREQQAEGLSAAAGPVDNALNTAAALEPPPSTIDLIDIRLRTLTGTIGSSFVPGQDSRQPAAESRIDQLDDPPLPPPRNNE